MNYSENMLTGNIKMNGFKGWDKEAFLRKYESLIVDLRNDANGSYYLIKNLRSEVFRNTVELVNQGFYYSDNGEKVIFPDSYEMIHNTMFYDSEFNVSDIPASYKTKVEIINADCLETAIDLKSKGYNIAVLNMANRRNPGGGVLTGASAQEETLFRRTNLFQSLYQFASYAPMYGLKKSVKQYPLDRNYGGIYTPYATIFRNDEKSGYELMAEPVAMSFISVAGMNRPDLTPDGMIVGNLVEPVKRKIRTIFRIGLRHGHDSFVLGALGCGAFRNPPKHISRLFHEVMEEEEFRNKSRLVVFSILEDHNSHKSYNPDGNFAPFYNEFINSDN